MLIDLHTHTRPLSWDSDLKPDDLIDLSKKAGLDGVCLSEHDAFWEPEVVKRLAVKHDFLVLPAVEINTEFGHILCYGLEHYIYGMHHWAQLAGHIEVARGAMVAPHPYRRQMPWNQAKEEEYEAALQRAAVNPAYAACAALERWNGRGTEAENTFSGRLIDRLGVASTGASDAHKKDDIGRYATDFLDKITGVEDLIAALKAGRFRPVQLAPIALDA